MLDAGILVLDGGVLPQIHWTPVIDLSSVDHLSGLQSATRISNIHMLIRKLISQPSGLDPAAAYAYRYLRHSALLTRSRSFPSVPVTTALRSDKPRPTGSSKSRCDS